MKKTKKVELSKVASVKALGGPRVLITFENGRVIDVLLPQVKDASRVTVVDNGTGIDPHDGGGSFGAYTLAKMPCVVEVSAPRKRSA